MRKITILLMSLFATVGLVACGGETEEKEVGSVETGEASEAEEVSENDDEAEDETEDYDEVLLDSENALVTLESISHVKDETFDEEYHSIKLTIENKQDKTIVIQADEVSADGLMVTDNVFFSEEVAGGKKANGKMQIETFDEDLPPLDEELEFKLLVIDEESYETLEEQQISVSIQ